MVNYRSNPFQMPSLDLASKLLAATSIAGLVFLLAYHSGRSQGLQERDTALVELQRVLAQRDTAIMAGQRAGEAARRLQADCQPCPTCEAGTTARRMGVRR